MIADATPKAIEERKVTLRRAGEAEDEAGSNCAYAEKPFDKKLRILRLRARRRNVSNDK